MDITQLQQCTLAGMMLVTVGFFYTLRVMALRQSAENQVANQAAAKRRAADEAWQRLRPKRRRGHA